MYATAVVPFVTSEEQFSLERMYVHLLTNTCILRI